MSWILISDLRNKQNAALVKRDTTLGNVKAMYNRFVSESTGKVSIAYVQVMFRYLRFLPHWTSAWDSELALTELDTTTYS